MMNRIMIFMMIFPFLGGCVNPLEEAPDTPKEMPRALTEPEAALVGSMRRFSFDLFRSVADEHGEENILLSPLGISGALAVAMNGAFGDTREEIGRTLYLSPAESDLQQINKAYRGLSDLLLDLDTHVDMIPVGGLWHSDELEVKEDFRDLAWDRFRADVMGVDTEDSDAADAINEWVDGKTHGRIDHIISHVSRYMVMQLISAATFEGRWKYNFDPDQIRQEEFYPEYVSPVTIDMMVLRARLPVYRSQMVQMIELPYGDEFFTMTLLMPGDEDDSMEEFIEETLTEENVSFWQAELSEAEVELHMPRFDMEYTLDLKEVLEEMGMERPFERSADFYYVSDEKRMYLNEFRHKSFVTVQEHGLEEAEALSTDTPPVISFNRPFVYLIRQQQTGAILFMGLMNDPGG